MEILTIVIYMLIFVITLGSALLVVLARNTLYSALALIVTMCAIAANFLLMRAELVALVQILVYAGAIMVLFLFVIMLLNIREGEQPAELALPRRTIGILLALVFICQTGYVAWRLFRVESVGGGLLIFDLARRDAELGQAALATQLYTKYMLPFELTSVLLLAAIIGALAIGLRDARREA